MAYEDIVSPIAEFFGITPEAALRGRTGPRATDTNFADTIFGITPEELKAEKKLQQDYINDELYRDKVESLRGTYVPGQSKGTSLEQIQRLTKLRDNKDYDNSAAGKAAAAQLELLRGDRINAQKQFEYLQNKDDNRTALARADRLQAKADDRRDRLDLLDRQDHRYSQEMQRYDKRRQKETIQSLVAGLASLGAAFAM